MERKNLYLGLYWTPTAHSTLQCALANCSCLRGFISVAPDNEIIYDYTMDDSFEEGINPTTVKARLLRRITWSMNRIMDHGIYRKTESDLYYYMAIILSVMKGKTEGLEKAYGAERVKKVLGKKIDPMAAERIAALQREQGKIQYEYSVKETKVINALHAERDKKLKVLADEIEKLRSM